MKRKEVPSRLLALSAGLVVAVGLSSLYAFNRGEPRMRPVPAQSQGMKARVQFEVLGTYRDRATGSTRAETHVSLGRGQSVTRYVRAGDVNDPSVCNLGFVREQSAVRPTYLWEMEASVLDVTQSGARVQLRWSRSVADGHGGMQVEAGDTRRLTLRPGEYQVFDYVNAPSGPCSSALLRILAEPVPEPVTQPPLSVDLWLAQDSENGRRWVHQRLTTDAGKPTPFRLESLKWSASGAPLNTDATTPAVGMALTGTITATLRPEGFLDMSVKAVRSLTWGSSTLNDAGEQDYRCELNESVALLLPEPRGEATAAAAGVGKAGRGVLISDDKAVIDFERFFAGAQASLYVLVTKQ
jgi:hypothetical protein